MKFTNIPDIKEVNRRTHNLSLSGGIVSSLFEQVADDIFR